MSKKEITILIIGVFVLVVGAGTAYWYWYLRSNTTTNQATVKSATPGNDNIALGGNESQSESSGLNVLDNDGGFQSNQTEKLKANENSTEGQSYTPPDTSKFIEYDKYKTATTALFGELITGTGNEVTNGKKVAVHYKGWLTNGKLFDESTQDKPFVFTLGQKQVIPGWEQGIIGMKVGGIRRIIVPPSVGYGAAGQASIPGNAVLIFDVQVIQMQ